MAGSRLQKFGTVFSRLKGLIRAGALSEADKPLWTDVYEAFPPKEAPLYERPEPEMVVNTILYPEDFIRVKFYKVYGNPDVVDLTNEKVKTTCQKFIEKYFELQKEGTPKENLFDDTVYALRQQGIRLRSQEDLQREQLKQAVASTTNTDTSVIKPLSVHEVFGEQTAKNATGEEEGDFISDDDETNT